MPAKNPRINVVLNDYLYQDIRLLAKKDNVSLSAKVKDLLKEALEIQEDIYLVMLAEKRETSWDDSTALSHEDIWS
ncbi:MAG: toxin-antitoxin system, antitoxin component [Deltaproteobacteria bacterium]|nr:toxin-antitoxin system, antitoxin component [Deltaproteobacteria bacterium]MBW1933507.1 toxin-antitoxin system, antitoxin component [Deltaproteobacteria bacterium]MBW1939507.1 toxin-antitoxin system, antitoxin component [Deltaproteobacteria bacterium]MBW1965245.1 toxin-antitoxin system, antitoxin component [Deltaproteobacteria bacterium]MBW2080942.1 toxin-antitoxin system, antitoxin component [Deltaproteobacteria bacterium]